MTRNVPSIETVRPIAEAAEGAVDGAAFAGNESVPRFAIFSTCCPAEATCSTGLRSGRSRPSSLRALSGRLASQSPAGRARETTP